MTLHVAHTPELESFVQHFGDDIEVLNPLPCKTRSSSKSRRIVGPRKSEVVRILASGAATLLSPVGSVSGGFEQKPSSTVRSSYFSIWSSPP
jgi:hypothetical protein